MSNDSQIRILFLTAEPTDTARLRLQQELREIKQGLQQANQRERFQLEFGFSARPRDVRQELQKFKPHFVHFSGHGTSTGELCFEDQLGKMQPVKPEALAALFKLVAAQVECVVLNACYSDIQAKAIVQHIPFVIGMNTAIGDQAAIAFAIGFYEALGENYSPEEAFKWGLVQIQLENIPEQLTPVLRKRVDKSSAVFYLERPAIEKRCYEEIKQLGSLIRIKAPGNMGKTWLMNRIVAYARENDYKTVTLSLNVLVDGSVSNYVDTFLHSFCVAVGNELGLPNQLSDYWENQAACIFNITNYFQRYLLANNSSPLLLALDDVDIIIEQPKIANSFFGMLRHWHELTKRSDKASGIWKRLRLIIVHSTEFFASLDINISPFSNVGLVIELPEFSLVEVQHLGKLHGLNWTENHVENLMNIVGGNPYLLMKACEYIKHHKISLEELLEVEFTQAEPYRNHLRELLEILENNPDLKTAFSNVINVEENNSVRLNPRQAMRLQRLGLVTLKGYFAKPSCELYSQYFRVYL